MSLTRLFSKKGQSDIEDKLNISNFLFADPNYNYRSLMYEGDLNSIVKNSIYNVAKTRVTNAPTAFTGAWGFVITLMHGHANTYGTQFFIGMNVDEIFKRNKANGTWGAWVKLHG